MFTWDRLRVFAAVAEHGSITGAAEALHITGPAVSQHLRKLEREARCPLVERDGRGIRLTAAGRMLADSALAMAGAATLAERDLATLDELVAGPLRLGAVASAVRTLLPDVLRELATAHPRLRPTLRDGEGIELLPALAAGRLDAVLMESWTCRPAPLPAGVQVVPLLTEEVRLAVHEAHPLAERTAVSLDELRDESWTSCPAGTDAYEAVLQTMRRHGVRGTLRYLVVDYGTQLSLVAAGLAVALVPRTGSPEHRPGVRFLACEPAVTRTLAVATEAHRDSPAVRALVSALTRRAPGRQPRAGTAG